MIAMPVLAARLATLATTAWCELATTARPFTVSCVSVRSGVLSVGALKEPTLKACASVPLLTERVSDELVPSASTLVDAPLMKAEVLPSILLVTIEPAPPTEPVEIENAPANTAMPSVLLASTPTLLVASTSAPPLMPAVTLVPITLVATDPAMPTCDDSATPTATVEIEAFEVALTTTSLPAVILAPVMPAVS